VTAASATRVGAPGQDPDSLCDMSQHDAPPNPIRHIEPPEQTLIMDAGTGQQLLWIDGPVTLPVGAIIELAYPQTNGVVTTVRLQGAGAGTRPVIVLDVTLV
jgi:hypothetical protein